MTNVDIDLMNIIIDDGIFDAEFYRSQVAGLDMLSLPDLVRHYLNVGEQLGLAPSALFDPEYYLAVYPDLIAVASPMKHYLTYGREEGRYGSLAWHLIADELDELAVQEGLIPPPGCDRSDERYVSALALALGALDRDYGYFSKSFYMSRYPDLASDPMDPFLHFLKYGILENRITNVSLLNRIHFNEEVTDRQKPFIVVCVHEASKTGAPIVGLDLAKELTKNYNVIFISMREGPLLEIANELFPIVISTPSSELDNYFFIDYISENYEVVDVILSSACCQPLIHSFSTKNYRITCLVHEFWEYMNPFRNVIYLCDLLVFSSKELLKSWQSVLDDHSRAPDTVMVISQPASSASMRKLSKAEARAAVTAATGLDLEGATLVLGAGHIQIRKGTDIFLQIGSQLKREEGKFVTIWIGEQVSEFDPAFGIWFHAQLERSLDSSGVGAVHFEPAGPLYPILMDAADVFLVTSRLDPLPNVALDAAGRDVPVIAFSGATGLADVAEQGQMALVEVEIAAVDEVIAAIKSLASVA